MVELMIATSILLVVSGTALSLLSSFENQYTSTVLKADMHGGLRNTMETLEQEIGQAGLVTLAQTTLTGGVTAAAPSQTVNVVATTGMYAGEKLQIDLGSAQETITVTALTGTSITGIFQKSHASGAIVKVAGVFPQGILTSSTATQLNLFGDINADGNVVFLQYTCDITSGTLNRSITPVTANAKNAAVVLLDNLVANPAPAGGTPPPCFAYPTATSVNVAGTTYTFIPSVSVTLTGQSSQIDPTTKTYATETKVFPNLTPRNVVIGVGFAQSGLGNYLQPNPSSCLLLGTC